MGLRDPGRLTKLERLSDVLSFMEFVLRSSEEGKPTIKKVDNI